MKTLANCISVILLLTLNVGYSNAQLKHEYVDLGLPSGTLWATCNVGAENPWDYGDYFAWGETEPKEATYNYTWQYYKYANTRKFTKYCTNEERGYNGFSDGKIRLEPDDDAATVNWGGEWCMPTEEQWKELTHNCVWTMATQNGINGYEAKGPNGNTIFLPASGHKDGYDDGCILTTGPVDRTSIGKFGRYWSSSLCEQYGAFTFSFLFKEGDEPGVIAEYRYMGQSVRPVRCKQ